MLAHINTSGLRNINDVRNAILQYPIYPIMTTGVILTTMNLSDAYIDSTSKRMYIKIHMVVIFPCPIESNHFTKLNSKFINKNILLMHYDNYPSHQLSPLHEILTVGMLLTSRVYPMAPPSTLAERLRLTAQPPSLAAIYCRDICPTKP